MVRETSESLTKYYSTIGINSDVIPDEINNKLLKMVEFRNKHDTEFQQAFLSNNYIVVNAYYKGADLYRKFCENLIKLGPVLWDELSHIMYHGIEGIYSKYYIVDSFILMETIDKNLINDLKEIEKEMKEKENNNTINENEDNNYNTMSISIDYSPIYYTYEEKEEMS